MSNPSLLTLAQSLGAAFKARGYMLALAESCTGGLTAQSITSIAGSSAWFDRGFITYSNQSKIEMLGVLQQTLDQFGAVSEHTAAEMATGALKNSQSHIAGSITGIAGPDGGLATKPVGTVCFAWAELHKPVITITKHFNGTRDSIRQQAAMLMMTGLIAQLESGKKDL